MSTTHHAAAIVGCKIDKSEIFLKEKVRSCEHPLPEGVRFRNYAKFCPDCGKKLWREEQKTIPQYDCYEETLCGFRVFYNEYDDFVIVASEFTETDNHSLIPLNMINISATNIIMQRGLKNALKPHGLWNAETFGIWVVLWYS